MKHIISILIAVLFISGCGQAVNTTVITQQPTQITSTTNRLKVNESQEISTKDIPSYSNSPYIEINNNVPFFSGDEETTESFETYSDLDSLGRCGVAYANIGTDLMPTEKRGNIGQVKPSGWHTVKYDNVDGKYLYNRCHLIGYQLTAENANEKNLITGTRYMNVEGMLPFENMVADYIKETNNHVLYRVTPLYEDNNLVASGVLMEAESVEDDGDGILYNVFVYNVQPGILIDYETGESSSLENNIEKEQTRQKEKQNNIAEETYVLNTNSYKFHREDCSSVSKIKDTNKETFIGTREDLILQGYEPCGICKP